MPFPKPERDIDLYRRAISTLQAALPHGWTLTSGKSRSLADAPERLLVGAPGGEPDWKRPQLPPGSAHSVDVVGQNKLVAAVAVSGDGHVRVPAQVDQTAGAHARHYLHP